MMTTAWQLLDAAADVIERDGHTKGKMRDARGRYCAAGALEQVGAESGAYDALERAFSALAAAVTGAPAGRHVSPSVIPVWNDKPERTAAEVIAMLRAVAATEKARPVSVRRLAYPWMTAAVTERRCRRLLASKLTIASDGGGAVVVTIAQPAITYTEIEPELTT
jgi:hypothetical protein